MSRERLLDVSDLEPCEPPQQITAALAELPSGEQLRVIHRQEPQLLYATLQRAGFGWHTRRLATQRFEITIWHASDQTA